MSLEAASLRDNLIGLLEDRLNQRERNLATFNFVLNVGGERMPHSLSNSNESGIVDGQWAKQT